MPKLLDFKFPEGLYFLNRNYTELRRSSKIFFFCFRTALAGGSGLMSTGTRMKSGCEKRTH